MLFIFSPQNAKFQPSAFSRVSAGAADMKKSPPISPIAKGHSFEGQHGCINCTIDECHICICKEEMKNSWVDMAYPIDPYSEEKNRFLVCHDDRITCHPCPTGLVWDCVDKTCAAKSRCPDIPKPCWCACGRSKPTKTVTTVTTATITTVTTTTTTVTSTTTTLNPSNVVPPPPSTTTLIKKYTTETKSVCTTTSVASGEDESEIPCRDIKEPISATSVETATSTETKSLTSPSSNTTVIRTDDSCSGTTTTTSTTACPDSCPAMSTTIAVHPCKSDKILPAPTHPVPTTTHQVPTTAKAAETTTTTTATKAPKKKDCPGCDAITSMQFCVCNEALKAATDAHLSVFLCDPHSEDRFLVCQRDGAVFCEACASGSKWNFEKGVCASERKCLPIPPACANHIH